MDTTPASMAPSTTMPRDELIAAVTRLGPWFHQIDLGQDVKTREVSASAGPQPIDHPLSRWEAIKDSIPSDMSSMKVVDLGCADGFFSLQFALRGAARVVAVDPWSLAIERVKFVREVFGLQDVIEARRGSAYLVDELNGPFDVVFMLAVLYHLEHPLLFLQRVGAVTDVLYLESLALENDEDSFLYLRQPTEAGAGAQHLPKWVPTRRCLEDMLRWVGFENIQVISDDIPSRPIYLARKR